MILLMIFGAAAERIRIMSKKKPELLSQPGLLRILPRKCR
jgi:hypothetical protein